MNVLDVGLPANPDAERFLLTLSQEDQTFRLISAMIDTEDFSLESHRRIWGAIKELYSQGMGIDTLTLYGELKKRNQADSVGGLSYLTSLDNGLPLTANAEAYCRLVKERSILRRAIIGAQRLIDRCLLQEDSQESLTEAERFLRDLGQERQPASEFKTFGEILKDHGGLEEFTKRPDSGLQTPLKKLNDAIVGLLPGDMVVLGARPSSGKSALAQQIGVYVAERQDAGVAMFSLEMGPKRILMRSLSEQGDLSTNELRTGGLNFTQRHSLQSAMAAIHDIPYYTNTTARSFGAMYAALRRLMARTPVRLAIIDHLHLMRGANRSENRNQELERITADVKLMAVELGITVILVAQLSRASEKEGRAPQMSDLRDCGSIEANADIVMFLHRKEQMGSMQDKNRPIPIDLLLAKQRDGMAFVKLPLMFFGKHFRFAECEEKGNE